MNPLLDRLKERKLGQWALAYLAGAWLLLQVADILGNQFDWPGALLRSITVLLAVGFLAALVLAWYHGEQGRQRVSSVELLMLAGVLVLAGAAVAAVHDGTQPAGADARSEDDPFARSAATEANARSIAVLPFANLSAEAENAYFATGIQDEILTQLSRVRDLRVIGRTSVQGYGGTTKRAREIGEELGVASILEGSVQRVGGRIRVTTKLIDTDSEEQLWAERYDRDLSDVFAIQSEVAQQITDALQARLTQNERSLLARIPTEVPEAYDYYLRARDYDLRAAADQGMLRNAIRLYEQVIRLDPRFALAYAHLSGVHGRMHFHGHDATAARLRMAREAAEQALRLAPDLPEAHFALGRYHYFTRDYEAARRELEIAREGLPNDTEVAIFVALTQRRLGQFEAALAGLERVARLNSRNPDAFLHIGMTAYVAGDYARADSAFRRALALAPDHPLEIRQRGALWVDWWGTPDTLRALLATVPRGERESALGFERWWLEMLDRDYAAAVRAVSAISSPLFTSVLFIHQRNELLGIAYAAAGDSARARVQLDSGRVFLEQAVRDAPHDHRLHLTLARVYAELGRRQASLREAQRGVELLSPAKDLYDGPINLLDYAAIHVRLGNVDHALEVLGSMQRSGHTSANRLRLDPRWDRLRADPRFQRLLREWER